MTSSLHRRTIPPRRQILCRVFRIKTVGSVGMRGIRSHSMRKKACGCLAIRLCSLRASNGNRFRPIGAARRWVRNCIAISNLDAKTGWQIKYYWGPQTQGKPTAFFDSGTDKFWYWPLDGFMHQGSLYLALSMLKDKPGQGVFSFETIGVRLAKITNPWAEPLKWQIEYLKLAEGGSAWPGSSIAIDGDYANFFTLDEDVQRHQQHMLLTRVALTQLERPAAHLEYLAKDNTWKAGLNRDDARIVMPSGSSEMSVRYHPALRQWVAVTGGGFLSDKIMVSTAAALQGPWSEPKAVCEMPEMNPNTAGYDRDTWGYAVKEHIEFATGNRLLVTYACNSFKFDKLLANMSIYRPQAVWIELPK